MNKLVISIIVVFVLVTTLIIGQAMAEGPIYTLSQNHYNVSTSSGYLTLYTNNEVGGNPSNYITLSAAIVLQTTAGPRSFTSGTRIRCDYPPGVPNPCTGA